MDYMEWFAARLAELRIEKGVSARDMSLSLGQSESYINKIENHRTMPSMAGFFYICEYFGISPEDFFRTECHSLQKTPEIVEEMEKLSPKQAEHILALIKDLNSK
ncbi:MAG: helix-turn-helix transcriptional regulator [Oscillospiraceae bacterium]|nr:helix-turn-helix transcriptional regulator [Oscillospiraceae bacterium]